MMKLLATVAVAALALASPVFAQDSTPMVSGPSLTCGPHTASTSTDTTASTSVTTPSTMALGADNQVNAQTVRTSLSNSQTNVDKLSTLGATTVVCIVDLDTLAESDATLKEVR
jgi:Tfp pilus assembly major pilin PilA